ncbi:ABC transporter substrate-binding protein [Nakamurella aerolata]|uniref:ABC transporter substrate-binding protein n=1 Tax=Nakamurella aerolata TaxID=1656892 RepID=A0A849ABX6_9ACTN|nr:ABC transporter substrate-binding protein [Nakamurella aerolata]NNG36651.1 ABC transporter substrate-binding protein [Nakamurella aerolata]
MKTQRLFTKMTGPKMPGRKMTGRTAGLVAVGVAAALALTACGGSDPTQTSSPSADGGTTDAGAAAGGDAAGSAAGAADSGAAGSGAAGSGAAGSGAAGSGAAGSGAAGSGANTATGGQVVIGSANFPESQLLATIYSKALQAKGVDVSTKLNIGSREIYLNALEKGDINMIPEYTGGLLNWYDKESKATAPEEVYQGVQSSLPNGFTLLKMSKAEDKDSVTVTKETADKWQLKTISDLSGHAGEMVLAGPPEWQTRPDGVPGLKSVYGLTFKTFKPFSADASPVKLLTSNVAQAANVFTTDPAFDQAPIVALEDDKQMFAAQNVVPLISEKVATDQVRSTLDAVSDALTTDDLVQLNSAVSVDKKPVDQVAGDWVKSKNLG